MGQYYKPVCLETQEYLQAHEFNNGLKLMEHSYINNNFVAAVENLISPFKPWHKQRLVWAGDYADDEKYIEGYPNIEYKDNGGTSHTHNLYTYALDHFKKLDPKDTDQERDESLRYLVNYDLEEYVDMDAVPEFDKGWRIHPLPLLTACGNGRGGGDFRGKNPHVGAWAGHRIGMQYNRPKGFNEIKPDFKE